MVESEKERIGRRIADGERRMAIGNRKISMTFINR
jgi:hypothetical protein